MIRTTEYVKSSRSAKDFHIYVPTSIVAAPSLDGLSGSLWNGFHAAVDPATAATFWTAVATFCYTEAGMVRFEGDGIKSDFRISEGSSTPHA